MKKIALLILTVIWFLNGTAQNLSLSDLYARTYQISELSNQGSYIEVLDKADSTLRDYADFEGADPYKAYLYVYKANTFMALGDLMLARHSDSLALYYCQQSAHPDLGFLIRNNMAVIEMDRRNYKACLIQCADLLNDSEYHPDDDQKLMIMNNMALSAFKSGKIEIADSLYKILIEKASSGGDYRAFDPALAYRNFGQYLMKQGNGAHAKRMLQLAYGLYTDSLGSYSSQTGQTALYLGQCYRLLNQNDSAGYFLDEAVRILDQDPKSKLVSPNPVEAIQAYSARSKFHCDMGRTKLGVRDIESAMQLIDKTMRYYAASESGVILAGLVRPVYDQAVGLYVKIAQEQQNNEAFLEAIHASDKGKRLSLQTMNFMARNNFSSEDWEVAYKEYIMARLAIEQPGNEGGADEEFHRLTAAKTILDSVTGIKVVDYLSTEESKFRIKNLPKPLIMFHDFGNVYGVFRIRKNKVEYHELQITEELDKLIKFFKDLLAEKRSNHYSRSDIEEFVELSASLSRQMEPFMGHVKNKRFYIQTDGIFNGFPFEALIDPEPGITQGETQEFRDLSYQLQETYVHYLVSLQKISKNSSGLDWIQFSGHSSVDTLHYQASALEGKIDWYKILQKDYRGKSVLLNSCETGVGIYQPGEGLMSLGTAFLLAGADQVVETRWKYAEAPAQEMARLFYRYGGQRDPSRALIKATKEYLKNCPPGTDHPHYWAGISVQGYGHSRSGFTVFLIVLIFLTVILLIVLKNN